MNFTDPLSYLSAILPFFSAFISLCLGIAVYFLAETSLRKTFLRLCFITFYWQFSWVILFIHQSSEYADLICRIGYSGIIFLPLSAYETIAHYLNITKKDIAVLYGVCFGLLISLWTSDLFILGPHLYWFGYYPRANCLHVLYLGMVVYLIIRNIYVLIQFHRNESDPLRKTQLKFFLLSSVIFSFSAIDYLLNYPGLAEKFPFPLYPVGVFFISFSIFIFILSHFLTLNLTLEKRVTEKTIQLSDSIKALEKAADVKKDFIANITHELRTPLTLIRGWTDLMLEGESGPIPGQLSDIINRIKVQTLTLTSKINNLLKVSKYDAGMTGLVLEKIDINDHISQIVTSFKSLTNTKSIGLNYHGTPGIKQIYLDKEKLTDIMNNLIRNACKFTDAGEIIINLFVRDDCICIEVKDTGIGISPKVLKHIFHRFHQGDNSKTRQYEGTGLGLAIVKESMDLMHGNIQVKSIENKGSCFYLELPCDLNILEPSSIIEQRQKNRRSRQVKILHQDRRNKKRRDKDLAAIDSNDIVHIHLNGRPAGQKITKFQAVDPKGCIVIAEDNYGIQDLLCQALKDYTLHVTGNGMDAWNTIKKDRPDLVITDIMMPCMDGFSLLEKIRSLKETACIPVIMITALSDRDDRIKALQMRADDFLTKPFHHMELRARVKNVISLHKLEREKTKTEQLEIFLMVLASAIESKDQYTGNHVERVANYARDLARKLNLSTDRVNEIYLGAIVHDVGKIGIKDEVLNKPGRLTHEEFEHIKEHPGIGRDLLSKLETVPVAVNIAYFHHEKWNGTGYPTGSREKQIPLEARIATIADFWDAITSDRPYRKAMPLDKAIKIMREERGKSFDPELLDLFMDETDQLYLKYIPKERLVELAN